MSLNLSEFEQQFRAIHYPADPIISTDKLDVFIPYYYKKYQICQLCNPRFIAEIGVRTGYSAWSFLKACPSAKYTGFDANNGRWGGSKTAEYKDWALKILAGYNVTYIDLDTQSVSQLPEIGQVDFFHVDGDHNYKAALHDLDIAWLKLAGGYLLVDDVDFIPQVKAAVDTFIGGHQHPSFIYIPSHRGEILMRKQ